MQAGLFVTLETESRFDLAAHLAELTAQVRTARKTPGSARCGSRNIS